MLKYFCGARLTNTILKTKLMTKLSLSFLRNRAMLLTGKVVCLLLAKVEAQILYFAQRLCHLSASSSQKLV